MNKIVFRDIVEKPTCWVDRVGTVVNGDCYWIASEDTGKDRLLWLAAAIGNSSFIEKYYDHCFVNKLYAGRRRFMSQYIEQFPLPNPNSTISNEIISLSEKAYISCGTSEYDVVYAELDKLVWEAFGLSVEEVRR